MIDPSPQTRARHYQRRVHTLAEKVVDAVVHGAGLLVAVSAGAILLAATLVRTAPEAFPAAAVYVGSLIVLLSVSLAFNMWPRTTVKHVLARFDQAAIFLFIAGTYTPFLSLVWNSPKGVGMTVFVWSAAMIGMALKLIVPHRFGRLAIPFYLGLGWSGVVVFHDLAQALPPAALWLLLAGGLSYSFGLVFHLWERLKFYNALWHLFVVMGASLHLFAVLDALVFSRW